MKRTSTDAQRRELQAGSIGGPTGPLVAELWIIIVPIGRRWVGLPLVLCVVVSTRTALCVAAVITKKVGRAVVAAGKREPCFLA
jgi:hypothetical protein